MKVLYSIKNDPKKHSFHIVKKIWRGYDGMVIVSYIIGYANRTQKLASIAQAYTGCPALRTGSGWLKNSFVICELYPLV